MNYPGLSADRLAHEVDLRSNENRTSVAKPGECPERYGTAKEAAEKLLFLKGTAFRPYM
jgi:hypothetical protein